MKKFFKDESGQGMVEYGLIIALIAIVVIVALKTLAGDDDSGLKGIFNNAAEELDGATTPTGGAPGGGN